MNQYVLSGIAIIAVVIIGATVFWGTDNTAHNPEETTAPESEPQEESFSDDLVVTFVPYLSEEFNFSLIRPEEAQIAQEGPNNAHVKFTFLGEDNVPNTEITDGFTFTVHWDEQARAYTSLHEYARARRAEAIQGPLEEVSALVETTFGDMSAYRYHYASISGIEVVEHVFLPRAGIGYTVTYAIADPNKRGYKGVVTTMLESLEFTL